MMINPVSSAPSAPTPATPPAQPQPKSQTTSSSSPRDSVHLTSAAGHDGDGDGH